MLLRIVLFFNLLLITSLALNAQLQPIGNWREHLPYRQAIHVQASAGFIWCATPYSVFSVDAAENSITRWSRMNGLSETGVSTIGTDSAADKLVIAYTNSHVDVLHRNNIYGISAFKNATINGDKTIYSVYVYQQLAYLATGIGIIVIDLQKYEVKDTYIIGNGGNNIRVTSITTDGTWLYAATEEGLKKAALNNDNLADFRNWAMVSGAAGLAAGAAQQVVNWQQKLLVDKDDSLFILNNNNWQLFYSDTRHINDITTSGSKLLLSKDGSVVSLSASGNVEQIISDNVFTLSPKQAIYFRNNYWIADTLAGLTRYNGARFDSYVPNSPPGIATGGMQSLNNKTWVAAGAVNTTWQPTGNKSGLYNFSDQQQWNYLNASNTPAFDSLTDIITVAIDPFSDNIWAGSYGGGLVNIQPNNAIAVYKQNSSVQPAYFSANSYRIGGLAFDNDRNLWITNYGAEKELLVRKPDGKWNTFTIPYPIAENAVSQIVIDDLNQKWIVSPKGNGLFCFNHGQTIENPGDDQWKWLKTGTGSGNLPNNTVYCIAKDKNSFIWVGTAQGVGVIQCPQQLFTQGCDAVLPIVQQDNFAGYLFRDEQVQTIVVDAADRKWVGTKNGVWLISPDGSKTIYRFTEANSPLLSNDVQQITIDGKTGEVFFATIKGICSFRSTATEPDATSGSDAVVFPNPVPPGYAGTIAIRGVPANSIVKITEMDGRLVREIRALGTQATWNGKNYKGQNITSGVYLVMAKSDNGQDKLMTKIIFVSQP
ncbi:MAG: two-component regulator propeller domain-containing protein [Chitinophagaceae bacterium]